MVWLTMNPSPPLGFLQLSPELRLEVYRHICPTITGFSHDDWSGLYYSCHTVQHEMNVECSKPLLAALNSLKKHECIFTVEVSFLDSSRHIHAPTTFTHLKNIHVHVHIDLERFLETESIADLESIYEYVNFPRKRRVFNGPAFMEIFAPLLYWSITELSLHFRVGRFSSRRTPNWKLLTADDFLMVTTILIDQFPHLRTAPYQSLRKVVIDVDCKQRKCKKDLVRSGPWSCPTWCTQGSITSIYNTVWTPNRVFFEDTMPKAVEERTRQSIERFDRYCRVKEGVLSMSERTQSGMLTRVRGMITPEIC
jgi:hypothetical protein